MKLSKVNQIMSGEHLYLKATKEVEGSSKCEALWYKPTALTNGDTNLSKYKHINLRVEQLKNGSEVSERPQPKFTLSRTAIFLVFLIGSINSHAKTGSSLHCEKATSVMGQLVSDANQRYGLATGWFNSTKSVYKCAIPTLERTGLRETFYISLVNHDYYASGGSSGAPSVLFLSYLRYATWMHFNFDDEKFGTKEFHKNKTPLENLGKDIFIIPSFSSRGLNWPYFIDRLDLSNGQLIAVGLYVKDTDWWKKPTGEKIYTIKVSKDGFELIDR